MYLMLLLRIHDCGEQEYESMVAENETKREAAYKKTKDLETQLSSLQQVQINNAVQ